MKSKNGGLLRMPALKGVSYTFGRLLLGAYDADKDAAFRHCYAFCIPSTLEGLPMSLLETMSYGNIAIASDIPACHEALGECGIYVPYEDDKAICEVMKELAGNEAKYGWQKEANKQRAQVTFSWANTTKRYVEYVKSI